MSRSENSPEIRRILVPLDGSPSSLAALDTAAALAERLEAELLGLFIEDADLLRTAEYPFALEISAFSATVRRLEPAQLERQLRTLADRMREAMGDRLRGMRLRWSFRVARGSVAAEVFTAGADADLMVLGRAGRSMMGSGYLGSTARRVILQQSSGRMLVLSRMVSSSLPVTVIFDGTPPSRRGLETAILLLDGIKGSLRILVVGKNDQEAAAVQKDAFDLLQKGNRAAEFRVLVNPDLSDMIDRLRSEETGVLVLPCNRFQGEAVCTIIGKIPNPVLLVR